MESCAVSVEASWSSALLAILCNSDARSCIWHSLVRHLWLPGMNPQQQVFPELDPLPKPLDCLNPGPCPP